MKRKNFTGGPPAKKIKISTDEVDTQIPMEVDEIEENPNGMIVMDRERQQHVIFCLVLLILMRQWLQFQWN